MRGPAAPGPSRRCCAAPRRPRPSASAATGFDLSPTLTAIAVSSALLGCTLGAMFAGRAADEFGRIKVMVFAASGYGGRGEHDGEVGIDRFPLVVVDRAGFEVVLETFGTSPISGDARQPHRPG